MSHRSIWKAKLYILIDNGSTHNFLDINVANEMGCLLEKIKPLAVTAAGAVLCWHITNAVTSPGSFKGTLILTRSVHYHLIAATWYWAYNGFQRWALFFGTSSTREWSSHSMVNRMCCVESPKTVAKSSKGARWTSCCRSNLK